MSIEYLEIEIEELADDIEFEIEAEVDEVELEIDFAGEIITSGVAEVENYEGDYEVTPSFEEQILPTNQKFMNADVTINKIPITTVSNSSGGKTVIIGG